MLPLDDWGMKLLKQVLVVVIVIAVIMSLVMLFGCTITPDGAKFRYCNEPKVVMQYRPFVASPNIILKGYDEDCDNDIDYWQHYENGQPLGRKIMVKR